MKRKLSDEQIDRLAKKLLDDFAPADETLGKIAESPKLWWNVRNRIEAEKTRRARSWFSPLLRPIPVFGALALIFCLGLTAFWLNSKLNQPIARENPLENQNGENAPTTDQQKFATSNADSKTPQTVNQPRSVPEKVSLKRTKPKTNFTSQQRQVEISTKELTKTSKKEILPKTRKEETRTDFIALSYASTSDSGQIIRVRVPSSMMVSLGVATDVEKESELVSAEVIVGDDGLARAIRFIR